MDIFFKNVLLIIVILSSTFYSSAVQMQDEVIVNISLSTYKPQNQSNQVFDSMIELNSGQNVVINVNDVPYNRIEFFVIQVHSFKYSTILSYNLTSYVNGTNIGLVQVVSKLKTYQFYLKNEQNNTNNTIYIAIIPYKQAPIPGGCNMEFMTEIAPYQILKYSDAIVTVDAQSASFKDQICENQIVKHEIYQMYLPEADYTSESYFEGIRNMLTVDSIYIYGSQVSRPVVGFLRQLYNAYKGTGSVYVIVAAVNNSRAAYVPIVTYACDINNPTESCDNLTTPVSKLLCGALVFLGLFICYSGHKFFRCEMFLVGSLVGAYITFLLLSSLVDMKERDLVMSSIGVGIVIGIVWLGFWIYCGIPVLSTMLPLLIFGFLVASIIFYAGMNDLNIVNNDITFWGFFTSIILLCMTILTGFMDKANIVACGIVGSYVFIIPLDHYFGTNLKYIFINIYRRITVENYRLAVINAPYQLKDLLLTVVWLTLAVTGVLYQWRQQEGRPPFPPTSSRMQRHPLNERTPLLIPTSRDPSDRIILIHSAPSDA